jgi:hypothetical protein
LIHWLKFGSVPNPPANKNAYIELKLAANTTNACPKGSATLCSKNHF